MAKDSTVVATTTQNKVAEIKVANADAIRTFTGVKGRLDQYGNVILPFGSNVVPKWGINEESTDTVGFTNSYKMPLDRFLAVMHQEAGFTCYWSEIAVNREETVSSRCNNSLFNNVENIANVLQDKSNGQALSVVLDAISADNHRNLSRSEARKDYIELLKNVCFDGIFVPLQIGETYTYHNGFTSEDSNSCRIACDFTIRMSPALRNKLSSYITNTEEENTEDWK